LARLSLLIFLGLQGRISRSSDPSRHELLLVLLRRLGHLQTAVSKSMLLPQQKNTGERFGVLCFAVLKYTESREVRSQVTQVPRLHCMNLGSEVQ